MNIDQSMLQQSIFGLCLILAIVCPARYGLALYAGLCFLPVVRVEATVLGSQVGVRPEDGVLAVLALRTLLTMPPRARSLHRPFVYCFALLTSTCLLSFTWTLVSPSGHHPSLYFAQKVCGSTILFWTMGRICRRPSDFRLPIASVLAAGALLFLLIQYNSTSTHTYFGSNARYYADMYNMKFRNVEGLASWNPNVLGLTFGMLTFLAAAAAFACPKGLRRNIMRGATIVFAIGTVQSYTRTAIISLGCAGVYCLGRFLSRQETRRTALKVCAAGVVLSVVAYAFLSREAFRFNWALDADRVPVWQAGLDLVLANPVGYGVGRGEAALADQIIFDSAHNDWIDYALQVGIPGAAFALFTFFLLYLELRLGARAAKSKSTFILLETTIVFLFCSSMALQVFTFAKQPFLIIGLIAWFVPGAPRAAAARASLYGRHAWGRFQGPSPQSEWLYEHAQHRSNPVH